MSIYVSAGGDAEESRVILVHRSTSGGERRDLGAIQVSLFWKDLLPSVFLSSLRHPALSQLPLPLYSPSSTV